MITELVINHTSDQHPWFQARARAPPGYACATTTCGATPTRSTPARAIIFTDTEKSNWTWDPVAKAYYWHRFFSHQPDLNFDNPRGARAMLDVMRFWLDMGVDGLRLDAMPYLIRARGHQLREPAGDARGPQASGAAMDEPTDRMLLAEANQWPEDVRAYFGDGDECHMAFHFPLMPRMFMALRQEDRYPIVEIINRPRRFPENCQWAIFLRNHDELTLEMVTDEERDYMYRIRARSPDARQRRHPRRLAPLLEQQPPEIELMNSLLLSMPGTPIVYYGDEIGMGDNVYLGDRNGVRTPMQWSSRSQRGVLTRRSGSSVRPVIMDPVYGPSPGSRQWRCWGQTEFPRIGEHPYFLTLAP